MSHDPHQPPGHDCAQEVADAFAVFLDTVASLTGLDLYDISAPDKSGLIGVCILNLPPSGCTSNWSNVPVRAQRILLNHHLNHTVAHIEGFVEPRKPD